MLGILAPNKLFLNSISVFTVYTELETLPSHKKLAFFRFKSDVSVSHIMSLLF